jgi:hypothetical protein
MPAKSPLAPQPPAPPAAAPLADIVHGSRTCYPCCTCAEDLSFKRNPPADLKKKKRPIDTKESNPDQGAVGPDGGGRPEQPLSCEEHKLHAPAKSPVDFEGRKIGLALSGGGFRASFFHLGVLRRLAELGLLRRVAVLSTVSGVIDPGGALLSEAQGRHGDRNA